MKKLTLTAQGELCYTISASNSPRLFVDPGETVAVETEDSYSGQIRKEGDRRDLITKPYSNPQSGPIFINGARAGDTLLVKILDIQPLIRQGATRIVSPWYSAKSDMDTFLRFLTVENIPHGTRICPIRDGKVVLGKFTLPYQPMIGTIGTAHQDEAHLGWFPGPHGGNMDLPILTVGATLHLPVRVNGALLHLGDVHAIQGDGEISGSAIEMPSLTTISIDLIKGCKIEWPRLENADAIYSIAATETGRTLEEAIRLGFFELISWLENEYSIPRWEAFQLLAMVAKIRLGNLWTVAVGIPRQYLQGSS